MTTDVVVIGAGVVGAADALGLDARTLRVLGLGGGHHDFGAVSANLGQGWLQGKGILGAALNRPLSEVGVFHIRPSMKPVTLGELASLHQPVIS